jgi:hypothetical protein
MKIGTLLVNSENFLQNISKYGETSYIACVSGPDILNKLLLPSDKSSVHVKTTE